MIARIVREVVLIDDAEGGAGFETGFDAQTKRQAAFRGGQAFRDEVRSGRRLRRCFDGIALEQVAPADARLRNDRPAILKRPGMLVGHAARTHCSPRSQQIESKWMFSGSQALTRLGMATARSPIAYSVFHYVEEMIAARAPVK